MINEEGGNNQEPNVTLEGLQGQNQGMPLPFDLSSLTKINEGDNQTGQVNTIPAATEQVPPPDVVDNNVESEYNQTINLFKTDEATLNDADRELKSNLLSIFNGEKVDETGNLLDKEGKVVLNSENFKKYIEENILPVDDKGNEVNDLGEIIRSKEDIDLDSSIVLSTKKTLEQNFGVTIEKNDYPDTNEGIVDLVQDLVKQVNTNSISKFLESNPELKGYFLHLKTGGSADNYKSQEINYKSVELNKLSVDEKLGYVKDLFSKKGLDGSSFIDLLKKAGDKEVETQAAKAILELDELQTKDKSSKEETFKQQRLQEIESEKKWWNDVKGIVDKGKLGDIVIPVSQRSAFFDYISKPVDKEGNSADAIKMNEDSEEFDLMVSYLRFNDFNVSKLASLISKQQNVATLRERMDRQKGTKVASEGTQNTNSGVGKPPISLEQMHGQIKR